MGSILLRWKRLSAMAFIFCCLTKCQKRLFSVEDSWFLLSLTFTSKSWSSPCAALKIGGHASFLILFLFSINFSGLDFCSFITSPFRSASRRVFCRQLFGLLHVAYWFFFGHVVAHFALEWVENVHVIDGLDTLPVAFHLVIEAADYLVHITLLLFVQHLCVSGLSFLELLILSQWWSFRLDAVKDHFLSLSGSTICSDFLFVFSCCLPKNHLDEARNSFACINFPSSRWV